MIQYCGTNLVISLRWFVFIFDCRIIFNLKYMHCWQWLILCKGLFGYFLEAFLNLLFEIFPYLPRNCKNTVKTYTLLRFNKLLTFPKFLDVNIMKWYHKMQDVFVWCCRCRRPQLNVKNPEGERRRVVLALDLIFFLVVPGLLETASLNNSHISDCFAFSWLYMASAIKMFFIYLGQWLH